MISVGIDVSKGKSTVCLLKPYGEIICKPFEVQHTEKDLEELANLLQKLDGEIKIIMEANGIFIFYPDISSRERVLYLCY